MMIIEILNVFVIICCYFNIKYNISKGSTPQRSAPDIGTTDFYFEDRREIMLRISTKVL